MANACDWEPVDRFKSLVDYEQFLSWLNRQVTEGRAAAVPVDPARGWGNAWDENWYRCDGDGEVWRLVGPDPPFRGIFKPVERNPDQPNKKSD